MQQQTELYKHHIRLQEEQQLNIRRIRHDFKSRAIMLLDLLKEGETDKAIDNLTQLLSKTSPPECRLKTGISTIDSILNYRAREAYDLNINVELSHAILEDIIIDPFEVGYILGNLLDNAIAAAKEVSYINNVNHPTIAITLNVAKNTIQLIVKNPYCKDAMQNKGRGFFQTQKKDVINHGLGLSIVTDIAKAHKGRLVLEKDEEYVTATVYMYQLLK